MPTPTLKILQLHRQCTLKTLQKTPQKQLHKKTLQKMLQKNSANFSLKVAKILEKSK
jgi:hypothetical protein